MKKLSNVEKEVYEFYHGIKEIDHNSSSLNCEPTEFNEILNSANLKVENMIIEAKKLIENMDIKQLEDFLHI